VRDLLSLHGPTRAKTKAHWDERDGGARLAHDKTMIATPYPNLRYGINARTEQIFLHGTLTLVSKSDVPTRVETRVIFPDHYPIEEPAAFDIADHFLPHHADRHFYTNGRCCLWLAEESQWDGDDPEALPKFIAQLALFFERQLIYEADPRKSWPWGQRSHGDEGFLEYLRDFLGGSQNLIEVFSPVITGGTVLQPGVKCPCKSGRKYKVCHAPIVEQIIRRTSMDYLRLVLAGQGRDSERAASKG
jgi:hypothetical protein